MNPYDQNLYWLRKWINKADNDLRNAIHVLKMGKNCPTDTVCFHSQQCVEKYLKAFLFHNHIDFPKTHDIPTLVELLPKSITIQLEPKDQETLSYYAVFPRYPDDYDEIPWSEAKTAVKLARQVRQQIRALLPPESLKKS